MQRPRPRGNDDMWVHDKAPGVPSSVINSAHGLGAANRASVNTKLIVSNLHYEVTAKDLIVSSLSVVENAATRSEYAILGRLWADWDARARAAHQSTITPLPCPVLFEKRTNNRHRNHSPSLPSTTAAAAPPGSRLSRMRRPSRRRVQRSNLTGYWLRVTSRFPLSPFAD